MAYKKMIDANPAIRGMKPKVTLSQANEIATIADALEAKTGDDGVKNPWVVAIKTFKKKYVVRGGKWKLESVVREKEATARSRMTEDVKIPGDSRIVEGVESTTEGKPVEEWWDNQTGEYHSTYGATSFDGLDASREMSDKTKELKDLIMDLKDMISNIAFSFQETDKVGTMQQLFDDFIPRARAILEADAEEKDPSVIEMKESYTAGASNMVALKEGNSDLLMLDVKPIRPGWGNTKDNNYYPVDVLKRDASKFKGAKMYETDHRPEEKNTRTWVSTIMDVIAIGNSGAPIVRVAVHDPSFAERVRNLNKADLLEKMECSILGSARGSDGFEQNGRKGRLIEAIASIESVDWVTRAGAGGHAVSLAENEDGGNTMKDNENENASQETEAPVVPIEEQKEPGQTDKSPEELQMLAEDDVRQLVENSKLPETAREKLMLAEYENKEAVEAAIQQEVEYITEITGSGAVFGMAENKPVEHTMTQMETNAAMDAVNTRHLGG